MPGFGFIHGDPAKLHESEEPKVEEQIVKVAAMEDDGVVTTTYNSISNTLYDLADANSKTTRVILPNGTTISLAATSRPGVGSYRATYEVAAKGGAPTQVQGTQGATDLAFKLDLLQLPEKDRKKLLRLNEQEQIAEARKHLPVLEEEHVKVSGYVTKSGKHVGSYSQIRKLLNKLGHNQKMELPDGVTVHRKDRPKGYKGGNATTFLVGHRAERSAVQTHSTSAAGEEVLAKSLKQTHEKSIGGKKSYDSIPDYQRKSGDSLIDFDSEHTPVEKLRSGKGTRVGNFMLTPIGRHGYQVMADDGTGKNRVITDSAEKAVRIAGEAGENPGGFHRQAQKEARERGEGKGSERASKPLTKSQRDAERKNETDAPRGTTTAPKEGKGGAAETIDKEKKKRKAQESVPSGSGFIRG